MITIGLTGRYCAGKSSLTPFFEMGGLKVIEVDQLGHQALSNSTKQLTNLFGLEILNEEGTVDRKKLGKIVFGDNKKLKELESIVHPKMVEEVVSLIELERAANTKGVIINAALLKRMNLEKLCDATIYVATPTLIRFFRSHKRDKTNIKKFVQIEKAQKEIRLKELKRSIKVFIIFNWVPRRFIYRQIEKFWATMGL